MPLWYARLLKVFDTNILDINTINVFTDVWTSTLPQLFPLLVEVDISKGFLRKWKDRNTALVITILS